MARNIAPRKLLELASAAHVLLVPTAATVFSDAVQKWSTLSKSLLMASWVVAAGYLVYDQVSRNIRSDGTYDAIDKLAVETRVRLRRQAADARDAAFQGFLTPDYWFPRKWSWTVYLYDEESELLSPTWPAPKDQDAAALISFASGNGATGLAWADEVTVVRTGSEVHDGTHGLNDEQQAHFKNRQAVVATPIWADTDKIGVLAGIADDVDELFNDDQARRAQLERTATILGTLLTTLKADD